MCIYVYEFWIYTIHINGFNERSLPEDTKKIYQLSIYHPDIVDGRLE